MLEKNNYLILCGKLCPFILPNKTRRYHGGFLKSTKMIIKRYFPGNPFDGDNQIIVFNNETPSLLQQITKLPLSLITNDMVQRVVTGDNNIGWKQNLMLRSIPLITSLIASQYSIPAGNAFALLQSIIVRYFAYKMTGTAQYGYTDMFRDATHLFRLGKNSYDNTLVVYNKGKGIIDTVTRWAGYLKLWKTTKIAVQNDARVTGIDLGNYVTEPLNQNVNPDFMSKLANKYFNMTHDTVNTKQLSQTSAQKTKTMIEEAMNHKKNNESEVIFNLSKKQTQNVNVDPISQQPEILQQPEVIETVTQMTLFGKVFLLTIACFVAFMGYKIINENYPGFWSNAINLKDNLINKIWKTTPKNQQNATIHEVDSLYNTKIFYTNDEKLYPIIQSNSSTASKNNPFIDTNDKTPESLIDYDRYEPTAPESSHNPFIIKDNVDPNPVINKLFNSNDINELKDIPQSDDSILKTSYNYIKDSLFN